MTTQWTGRWRVALAVIAALALLMVIAACGDDDSSDAGSASTAAASGVENPKVAGIFTQVVSQGNWDPAGNAAFEAMATKYGLDPTVVEQTSYEEAPSVLRRLADEGMGLIILHSSGYAAAVEEVAPDFPDTEFVVFSYAADTKGLKNYSAWSNDWDQYGFLIGTVAGSASAKGNVAIIGGEEIPSTKRSVEFMTKGIKNVNPDAKVSVSYIGSFTDAAKGKEIALQAISKGADFLIPAADSAGAGVQQAAEEGDGILTLGEYLDQSGSYPKSLVTSVEVNMNKAYDEIGAAYTDGTLDGQIVQMNVQKGDMQFILPFKHTAASVQETAMTTFDAIKDGSLDVATAK